MTTYHRFERSFENIDAFVDCFTMNFKLAYLYFRTGNSNFMINVCEDFIVCLDLTYDHLDSLAKTTKQEDNFISYRYIMRNYTAELYAGIELSGYRLCIDNEDIKILTHNLLIHLKDLYLVNPD
jgi:hypothetical protein